MLKQTSLPLKKRRIKLGMQYARKLKTYPSNHAYYCVFNPLFENVYDKHHNTIQPFGLFENFDGLPSAISIFSAETNAILLALKFVASSEKIKFMICSDSLSCLLAIESCKTQNPFILKIVEIYKSLVAIGKHVIFTWIPSHIGLRGNTVVDQEAKNALNGPVSNCFIPYTYFKPFIVKYILKCWQDSWD